MAGNTQHGFSLIELMIALALVAILAAIAVPLYNGYVETSREGALISTMSTIEAFQEDFRLRTGDYGTGNYDPAGGDTTITDEIGWDPRVENGTTFSVALTADEESYQITGTDETGVQVCRQYPENIPCP